MSIGGADLDKIQGVLPISTINSIDSKIDNLSLNIKRSGTALVQIITTPSITVTVTQNSTVKTATSNSIGVAEFELGLGFWNVAAGATYKILIEQTGRLYTLTAADKLDINECSWGLIDLIAKQNLAQQYFSIGDVKNISIAGETVTCQLVDFNHDNLTAGGKAKMSFILMNTLANRTMNATQVNTTSWRDSLMRTSHIPSIKTNIPSDLKAVVKNVNKTTATSGATSTLITTSDDFWLASEIEIFGTNTSSYAGEGTKYPMFTDAVSRTKKLGNSGSANYWWLRSPYNASNNTAYFVHVGSNGTLGNSGANGSYGVVLGFCV